MDPRFREDDEEPVLVRFASPHEHPGQQCAKAGIK